MCLQVLLNKGVNGSVTYHGKVSTLLIRVRKKAKCEPNIISQCLVSSVSYRRQDSLGYTACHWASMPPESGIPPLQESVYGGNQVKKDPKPDERASALCESDSVRLVTNAELVGVCNDHHIHSRVSAEQYRIL